MGYLDVLLCFLLVVVQDFKVCYERYGNWLDELVDIVLQKNCRLRKKYGRFLNVLDCLFQSVFKYINFGGDCDIMCVF